MTESLDALRRAEEEARRCVARAFFDWPDEINDDENDQWSNLSAAALIDYASAVERRVRAEAHEGMEDAFMIEGVVANKGGEPFTQKAASSLSRVFLEFMATRGLVFGGTLGIIHKGPRDETE